MDYTVRQMGPAGLFRIGARERPCVSECLPCASRGRSCHCAATAAASHLPAPPAPLQPPRTTSPAPPRHNKGQLNAAASPAEEPTASHTSTNRQICLKPKGERGNKSQPTGSDPLPPPPPPTLSPPVAPLPLIQTRRWDGRPPYHHITHRDRRPSRHMCSRAAAALLQGPRNAFH